VLPATLTHLTFDGNDFNQPLVSGVLPVTLTHLTFTSCSHFDQPLAAGVLPDALTHLSLGFYYSYSAPKLR
jgi:hypothetical protein